MKKFIILLLAVLIILPAVLAGDVLKLDFSNQNQQLVGLKEGDRAEFYLNGERNIIIIDKIKPDSVDITAFIALNTNNYPYYTTLNNNNTFRIDIERDDIDDLYINWYKSDLNLRYAYFLLKKPETSLTGNAVNGNIEREKREYDKYLVFGFCFVVIMIVTLLIFKHKKNKTNKN